jgi:hypothetical protein
VGGAKPSAVWVNPPQALSIPQLHVHVQPHLAAWLQEPLEVGEPMPPAVIAKQNRFYARVERELAKSLGA